MISDVLFEAIRDIRQYQKDWPDSYDGLKKQIDVVVETMNGLLEYLDTPPVKDGDVLKWKPVVSVYMRLLENPNTPPEFRQIIKKLIIQLAGIADGDVETLGGNGNGQRQESSGEEMFPARVGPEVRGVEQ